MLCGPLSGVRYLCCYSPVKRNFQQSTSRDAKRKSIGQAGIGTSHLVLCDERRSGTAQPQSIYASVFSAITVHTGVKSWRRRHRLVWPVERDPANRMLFTFAASLFICSTEKDSFFQRRIGVASFKFNHRSHAEDQLGSSMIRAYADKTIDDGRGQEHAQWPAANAAEQ